VGFDHGEWGGSLEVYAERGKSEQTLLDTNVRAIVPAFGQVVVLAADASLSHGWIRSQLRSIRCRLWGCRRRGGRHQ